jgi:hypothetical protein
VLAAWLPLWDGPEIAAYLAAMIADRHQRNRDQRDNRPVSPIGGATWVQPLNWFADNKMTRPPAHVRVSFSTRTLERGFRSLAKHDLVEIRRTTKNPNGGRRFRQPRSVYTNGFATLENTVDLMGEGALSQL